MPIEEIVFYVICAVVLLGVGTLSKMVLAGGRQIAALSKSKDDMEGELTGKLNRANADNKKLREMNETLTAENDEQSATLIELNRDLDNVPSRIDQAKVLAYQKGFEAATNMKKGATAIEIVPNQTSSKWRLLLLMEPGADEPLATLCNPKGTGWLDLDKALAAAELIARSKLEVRRE